MAPSLQCGGPMFDPRAPWHIVRNTQVGTHPSAAAVDHAATIGFMPPQPVYGRRDQFSNAESFDTAKAAELAERLETLHGSEAEQSVRASYLDLLEVGPGNKVLEVGCGNGWVLREIARRVGHDGRAVGLDASQELLTLAGQQAELERIEVE